MDLAREVDPLLELVGVLGLGGDDPRHRGERRRLAERPQQVPLGVVERRRADISRSARITPIARPAAVIGAHTSRTGSETSAAYSSGT